MNKKGTRNTNGEGCIYNTIAKQKRKIFLSEECSICKNCTDRSVCNNRSGYDKCEKCENCKTECLNYCDRFYCYERNQAQITINGKQTTVANEKKRKDAVQKKKETESKVLTKSYIKKNGILLPQKIHAIILNKYKSKITVDSTYKKDLDNLKHIESDPVLSEVPMQKITTQNIQDFINTKTYLSQSIIEAIFGLIKMAFNQAVDDKEIYVADNPVKSVIVPFSDKSTRIVQPFEYDEEQELIKYIFNNRLIKSNKSNYDNYTIQTIILTALFTGMRIGEIGSLNYNKHLDFEKKCFIVENTLTSDLESNIKIKDTTKTGKKAIAAGRLPYREIPFNLFCDDAFIIKILNEQIKISSNIIKNKNNLLFTQINGKCINPKQITNIFKRICRETKIKLDYDQGCHIHMCRHTFTTRCIEAGMDLMYIAELLGHSSTKQIEKTYGHILKKYKEKNHKKLKDSLKENPLLNFNVNENIF